MSLRVPPPLCRRHRRRQSLQRVPLLERRKDRLRIRHRSTQSHPPTNRMHRRRTNPAPTPKLLRLPSSSILLHPWLSQMWEDEAVQRHGVVGIRHGHQGSDHLPRSQWRELFKCARMTGIMPIRFRGFHFIAENSSTIQQVSSFIQLSFARDVRHRCVTHRGSIIEARYALMGYGIPVDLLPIDDDGEILLDNHNRWLRELERAEELILKQRANRRQQTMAITMAKGEHGGGDAFATTSELNVTDRENFMMIENNEFRDVNRMNSPTPSSSSGQSNSAHYAFDHIKWSSRRGGMKNPDALSASDGTTSRNTSVSTTATTAELSHGKFVSDGSDEFSKASSSSSAGCPPSPPTAANMEMDQVPTSTPTSASSSPSPSRPLVTGTIIIEDHGGERDGEVQATARGRSLPSGIRSEGTEVVEDPLLLLLDDDLDSTLLDFQVYQEKAAPEQAILEEVPAQAVTVIKAVHSEDKDHENDGGGDAGEENKARIHYLLSQHDVIFGRGRSFQDHSGNRRMRELVAEWFDQYNASPRKTKMAIAENIVHLIHNSGGRFLKKDAEADKNNRNHDTAKKQQERKNNIHDGSLWMEVSLVEAREKVQHAFRKKKEMDAIATKKKRQAEQKSLLSSLEGSWSSADKKKNDGTCREEGIHGGTGINLCSPNHGAPRFCDPGAADHHCAGSPSSSSKPAKKQRRRPGAVV
mmetsp:Transcript_5587/g.16559  ORF Transcript_5587/g.16559 Transcript_5587/m.16559 type:complete len:697 (-) Transcript_5587:170-2260(-)